MPITSEQRLMFELILLTEDEKAARHLYQKDGMVLSYQDKTIFILRTSPDTLTIVNGDEVSTVEEKQVLDELKTMLLIS